MTGRRRQEEERCRQLEEFYTPLIAINRCDRCGAQARVRVTVLVLEKGKDCELLFCRHHFNIHQPVLLYRGAKVRQDQRNELTLA
jgi:hypothetical protein